MKLQKICDNPPPLGDFVFLFVASEDMPFDPLIIVGSLLPDLEDENEVEHMWNFLYNDVVKTFKRQVPDWDHRFTHWAPIDVGE